MNCSRQPKVGRVFAVGEVALVFGTVDGFLLLENVNKNVLILVLLGKLSMTQLTFSVDVRNRNLSRFQITGKHLYRFWILLLA